MYPAEMLHAILDLTSQHENGLEYARKIISGISEEDIQKGFSESAPGELEEYKDVIGELFGDRTPEAGVERIDLLGLPQEKAWSIISSGDMIRKELLVDRESSSQYVWKMITFKAQATGVGLVTGDMSHLHGYAHEFKNALAFLTSVIEGNSSYHSKASMIKDTVANAAFNTFRKIRPNDPPTQCGREMSEVFASGVGKNVFDQYTETDIIRKLMKLGEDEEKRQSQLRNTQPPQEQIQRDEGASQAPANSLQFGVPLGMNNQTNGRGG
jgi:hypothetical protein